VPVDAVEIRLPAANYHHRIVAETNRLGEKASNESMLAGKRCSPALIVVFIAIIIGTLTFLALHHGPEKQPSSAPIHDQQ
jgi:hypothetical protein